MGRMRPAAFGLTVVRHGETRYNKEKILQGQGIDEPLSETGFRQANAAGLYLSNIKFTHVFTSDLLRAKQTTAAILKKSKFCKDVAVKYDARLRERKYGAAEGRPLSDLRTMAKAAGEQCPSFTPAGGETLEEVKARGKDFFEHLCCLVAQEARPENKAETEGSSTEMAGGSSTSSLTNHHSRLEFNSDRGAEILDANILVRTLYGYPMYLPEDYLSVVTLLQSKISPSGAILIPFQTWLLVSICMKEHEQTWSGGLTFPPTALRLFLLHEDLKWLNLDTCGSQQLVHCSTQVRSPVLQRAAPF
ncbi:fructose-2,6-bisphosphatase TIGAR isoform X1 [Podarcis raffonei]|uniref:fructose-2,6-bisphosphatase TIGAR isoform X1 n=1 Tax=Podarcis raffonei TaxID=65483 RepID=UPI0023299C10|nr:fructose-2,6-bisphosphatase TIGAR isoform X1 [Podarcis raffonei]